MLFPLSDGVWVMFFRGMVFGFFGGLVLILLFFWSSGKYGALAAAKPIGFVYFLAGLEIGIALIGTAVFAGLLVFLVINRPPLCRRGHGASCP